MTFNEKVSSMYVHISNGGNLNTRELMGCGFLNNEPTKLIRRGILIREENKIGNYKLADITALFEYGVDLYKHNEFARALNCFKRCYEVKKYHEGTNFYLFLNAICSKDFNGAVQYLSNIYQNDSEEKDKYDFYVFLMAKIVQLPRILTCRLRTINIENSIIDPEADEVTKAYYKKILNASYRRNFIFALKFLKSKEEQFTPVDFALLNLLEKIIVIQKSEIEVQKATAGRSFFTKKTKNLVDILVLLTENKVEDACTAARDYLKYIQKESYTKVVLTLIRTCVLEKGEDFEVPIIVLSDITTGFTSDAVGKYVELFEVAMQDKKYNLAKAYLEILIKIKGLSDEELIQLSRRLKMAVLKSQETQLVDLDSIYGIEGMLSLIWAVESGLSLKETFDRFPATLEQKCLVALILAKEAYTRSSFDLGDRYMRMVENSKQSDRVKSLFTYIKQNKQTLKNRVGKGDVPYVILPM